jgi:hypothetical protein
MPPVSLGRANQKQMVELLVILAGSIIVFILSAYYDLIEKVVIISHRYEHLQVDEFFTLTCFLSLALAVFSVRRWLELRKALSEIRQLRGLIPICSGCKKIRDDEGYWHQIEMYFHDHSEVEFSHGICPDCIEKLYPDIAEDLMKDIKTQC